MKIGISYIDGLNFGDQFIYFTTRYLVEKILRENHITGVELVPVDICQVMAITDMKRKNKKKTTFRGNAENFIREHTLDRVTRQLGKTRNVDRRQKLLVKSWHLSDHYYFFEKNEMDKFNDLNLFIFSGGGLIKYRQQRFHYILDEVTRICDKKNIPVLISAAGVEGYDENDPECRLLKEALNRNCVKFVSTRDDYETLKNCFITNPNIETALVCDPAFWATDRYGVQAEKNPEKLVGLNVIRPTIYRDYHCGVNIQELKNTYHELVQKLVEVGYKVELFTNGAAFDGKFIQNLLRSYSDLRSYNEEGRLSVFQPSQPKRLIKRLARYERFMAVRLHAAILGTALGVPNVSLVWNAKQLLFGKQTGTLGNFITKKNFNADYIYKRLISAKKYEGNQKYKASVYDSLDAQIKKYCKGGQ